jgi:hypothetical protein
MLEMDANDEGLYCACGRSFAQPNALSNHRRSCTSSKRRFNDMLTVAREAWEVRKKRKLNNFVERESTKSAPIPQAVSIHPMSLDLASLIVVAAAVEPDSGPSDTQLNPSTGTTGEKNGVSVASNTIDGQERSNKVCPTVLFPYLMNTTRRFL